MSDRPTLDAGLEPWLFREHYWLKSELTAFCRTHGLRTAGAKSQVAGRVEAWLLGVQQPAGPPPRRIGAMPVTFSRSTLIGDGWRCSQDLRAFLSAELGRPFHFDRAAREQIRHGAGHTLGQVLDQASARPVRPGPSEIEPQFEYNRFVRAYRLARPGGSHQDLVTAWRTYRGTPVSERPSVAAFAAARR